MTRNKIIVVVAAVLVIAFLIFQNYSNRVLVKDLELRNKELNEDYKELLLSVDSISKSITLLQEDYKHIEEKTISLEKDKQKIVNIYETKINYIDNMSDNDLVKFFTERYRGK
ncbi:MAG: hypothetical protein WD512_05915 [Candidatus Paceibacterota bacterium]